MSIHALKSSTKSYTSIYAVPDFFCLYMGAWSRGMILASHQQTQLKACEGSGVQFPLCPFLDVASMPGTSFGVSEAFFELEWTCIDVVERFLRWLRRSACGYKIHDADPDPEAGTSGFRAEDLSESSPSRAWLCTSSLWIKVVRMLHKLSSESADAK